jgi:integrase
MTIRERLLLGNALSTMRTCVMVTRAMAIVSPHGLRAGFVTTAYRSGVADKEIMGHTRHRSLTTMRSYVRRAKLGKDSPAGKLGL